MSNYNNKLQLNNNELQAILDDINNLPDAGSGGLDTSDATAVAEDIMLGETAYTASGKVTGTFTIAEEISDQETLLANIEAALANKVGGGDGNGDSQVNTCIVTITSFASNIRQYEYVSYENGLYTHHNNILGDRVSNVVLSNVVCGCTIYIYVSYPLCAFEANNDNYAYFTSGSDSCYFIPIGDISIEIIDDD